MRHRLQAIRQYIPWLLLLFGVNIFYALLLWAADMDAFYAMAAVILLAVILMFSQYAVC